jgi:hypothetical protein
MSSNWKQATEAMTAEAVAEFLREYAARGLCGAAEPVLPSPTMSRCNLPHSFALLKEKP